MVPCHVCGGCDPRAKDSALTKTCNLRLVENQNYNIRRRQWSAPETQEERMEQLRKRNEKDQE